VEQRKAMLNNLASATLLQDTTLDAMNQQATLIAILVVKPVELDSNSQDLAISLLRGVSVGILESTIDDATARAISEGASSIIDAKFTARAKAIGEGGRRRRLEEESSNFTEISSIVNNLQAARISSVYSGEDAVSIVTTNIKMSSKKVSIVESEGASFSPPRTELDATTGRLSSIVALPTAGVGAFMSSSACHVGIGVTELGPHRRTILLEKIDSTVMRFNIGCASDDAGSSRANDEGIEKINEDERRSRWRRRVLLLEDERRTLEESSSSSDYVIITMQNSNNGEHLLNNTLPPLEHVITCDWDEHLTKSVFCPSTGVYIARECTGELRFLFLLCVIIFSSHNNLQRTTRTVRSLSPLTRFITALSNHLFNCPFKITRCVQHF
jgi:hypothetical protein